MKHTSHSTGATTGSLKSYITGFILSVVLTAMAFGAVMSEALAPRVTIITIFTAAVLQILVHLYYFLHLNSSSEARWNILAMIFTVLIMALFVGGSIWIMHNLNIRMM